MTKAVILVAMQAEAAPIIEALNLELNDFVSPLPFKRYKGSFRQLEIALFTSGLDNRHGVDNIGCEPATLMAHIAIEAYQPDLIISAGTAGGFAANGSTIGEVFLSTEFVFNDRHVPLDGFEESANGHYPSFDTRSLADSLRLRRGVFSTGSSLEKSAKDLAKAESLNAVSKDMESAAIAWVAMLHNKPLLGIRSITNLVDLENDSETEFLKNFETAKVALRKKLLNLLTDISEKV